MIKKDQYEAIAECIRSEQMSAPEIADLFEDSKFYKWYRRKFDLGSYRDETPQAEWLEGYYEWKGKNKKERCPHN